MTLKERIKMLANSEGLSLPKLEEELGFGGGTISRWDKSAPSADKLAKIADRYKVTVDYLLGREQAEAEIPIINERFKALRIACDKSPEEWAIILGITKSRVIDIENGYKSITDKLLSMLDDFDCDGRTINISWVKDGSGDMFHSEPLNESMIARIEELLEEKDTTTKKAIIAFLAMYAKFDDSSRPVLNKAIDMWMNEMEKAGD